MCSQATFMDDSKYPRMSDPAFLVTAEQIGLEKCYEPKLALKALVRGMENRVEIRIKSFTDRYAVVRERLEAYAQACVDSEMPRVEGTEKRFAANCAATEVVFRELHSLQRQFDSTPNSPKQRKKILRAMKEELRKVESLERQMDEYGAVISESRSRIQIVIPKAQEVWAAIRGLEDFLLRLEFRLWWAEMRVSAIRLLYLSLAILVAVGLDRFTQIGDGLASRWGVAQGHDLTVAALFALQVLILEPRFDWLRSTLHWRSYGSILQTCKRTVEEISAMDHKLSEAETGLSHLMGRRL